MSVLMIVHIIVVYNAALNSSDNLQTIVTAQILSILEERDRPK